MGPFRGRVVKKYLCLTLFSVVFPSACGGPMDIVIVLDGSNSIYPWTPINEFLKKLLPTLDIGPQSTHVGLSLSLAPSFSLSPFSLSPSLSFSCSLLSFSLSRSLFTSISTAVWGCIVCVCVCYPFLYCSSVKNITWHVHRLKGEVWPLVFMTDWSSWQTGCYSWQ